METHARPKPKTDLMLLAWMRKWVHMHRTRLSTKSIARVAGRRVAGGGWWAAASGRSWWAAEDCG